jgi:hypothetical protein
MANALCVSRQRASQIAATDLAPHLQAILGKIVETLGEDASLVCRRAC